MSTRFARLEEVVQDPVFPAVDVALRRGRHIDRDDGEWYAFISDAQDHLEQLYHRYGCELVTQSDGYIYLLPSGDQLRRRHLSAGEMLVGQTLALQYLDPSTVQSGGVVTRQQLLSRLTGLIGDRELAKVFDPQRKRFDDERIVHEIIRKRVAEGVRRLASLGFIETIDDEQVRLRAPLLRFADPVRGLADVGVAMERLIASGEIVDLGDDGAGDNDPGVEENTDDDEHRQTDGLSSDEDEDEA